LKDENMIMSTLQGAGAIITDSHLVYTSGLHGSTSVNKYALYTDSVSVSSVCSILATAIITAGIDAQVIVGPAMGGITLSQWTAYHLWRKLGSKVLSVFAEKIFLGDAMELKHGYEKIVKDKRVFIVEDVLTTGGSVKKTIEAVSRACGTVVGVDLFNRGNITAESLGVPRLMSLVELELSTYNPETCPLCATGVPINTDVGKGKEFLASKHS